MNAFPRTLLAIVWTLAAALPGQEAPKPPADRRAQLLELTRSDDALLRGEAALALAEIGNAADGQRLLELSEDRSPACAARALLAVGELCPLGFESVLERVTRDEKRSDLEREAAFYALGAATSDDALTTIGRVFEQFDGANFGRSRFRLAALISGLGRSGDVGRSEWVRRLLGDAALRDPSLRALIVATLRAMNAGPLREELDELLDHPIAEIRAAAARSIIGASFELDAELSHALITLATRDRSVSVRTAALNTLESRGFEPLVGPARRAILQDEPQLAALGARILLRSGTDRDRKKLVERIRKGSAAGDAMLAVWTGPAPTKLSDHVTEIANDSMHEASGRLAALLLEGVVPPHDQRRILEELLRSSSDPVVVAGCLGRLRRLDPEVSPLRDLGDLSKAEPERWATRLRVLARVAPDQAERLLDGLLALDDPAVAATALSARRSGRADLQATDPEQTNLEPLSPGLRAIVSGSTLGS